MNDRNSLENQMLEANKAGDLIETLQKRNKELLIACKHARSVIDHIMGDTDLDGDNSEEMKCMKMLSKAIALAEGKV